MMAATTLESFRNRSREPLSGWRWPSFRGRPALALLAIHLLAGLWLGSLAVLNARLSGIPLAWSEACFREVSAALAVWAMFPVPLAVVLNAPRPAGRWGRFLALHGLAAALFLFLTPGLFRAVRSLCWPLFGWGSYVCGPIRLILPYELQRMAFVYALILGVLYGYQHLAARRALAAREAQLQAQLQDARLRNLSAQLDPHFLFNALNTISSRMYEDLPGSDRLFSSLGQMLRDNLEEGGATWALRRELNHLESFLDFVRARFGDRLRIALEVDAGLGHCQVPRFALQRLVENSVKHNQDRCRDTLAIRILARAEGGMLVVRVEDDGQGFRDPDTARSEGGLGLRNLEAALELLHGPGAVLELLNRPEGGASVGFRMPLEVSHG